MLTFANWHTTCAAESEGSVISFRAQVSFICHSVAGLHSEILVVVKSGHVSQKKVLDKLKF